MNSLANSLLKSLDYHLCGTYFPNWGKDNNNWVLCKYHHRDNVTFLTDIKTGEQTMVWEIVDPTQTAKWVLFGPQKTFVFSAKANNVYNHPIYKEVIK